ncbi:hypothetical protein BDW62DRAFT_83764 [Aspergillus aurantiobrunneus]
METGGNSNTCKKHLVLFSAMIHEAASGEADLTISVETCEHTLQSRVREFVVCAEGVCVCFVYFWEASRPVLCGQAILCLLVSEEWKYCVDIHLLFLLIWRLLFQIPLNSAFSCLSQHCPLFFTLFPMQYLGLHLLRRARQLNISCKPRNRYWPAHTNSLQPQRVDSVTFLLRKI